MVSLAGMATPADGNVTMVAENINEVFDITNFVAIYYRPANLQNVQIWRPCKKAQKNLEIGTSNLEISKICVK